MKKIICLSLTIIMFLVSFAGCSERKEQIVEKEKLVVWSHLSSTEVKIINKVAQKWGKKNNINVEVVKQDGEMQSAISDLAKGEGPDIYFGLSNDNLGTYKKNELLTKVPDEYINDSRYTSNLVINSITMGQDQYAMPLAQETIALIYNKDKIDNVPSSFEDLINLVKSDPDNKGINFNINDFYLDFGFIASNGGYVFGNKAGSVNTKDIGLGNEGATIGYRFIQDLVNQNLISSDTDDSKALEDFTSGKTAFYISGPWAIDSIKKSGINYGVAQFPTLNGQTIKPFLGVQCAFVTTKCSNKELAWKLTDYLSRNTAEILMEDGQRLPVLKSVENGKKFKDNTDVQMFIKQAESTIVMPNYSEFQCMWLPTKDVINKLVNNEISPEDAGKEIVNKMNISIGSLY